MGALGESGWVTYWLGDSGREGRPDVGAASPPAASCGSPLIWKAPSLWKPFSFSPSALGPSATHGPSSKASQASLAGLAGFVTSAAHVTERDRRRRTARSTDSPFSTASTAAARHALLLDGAFIVAGGALS